MYLKKGLVTLLALCLFMPINCYAVNIAQSICEYIAVDDKKRMRSLLKTNKIKIRKLFSDVTCNNQNMLIFAGSNSSLEIGEMIIKKLPKKVLKEHISELEATSADLAAIAKERIG